METLLLTVGEQCFAAVANCNRRELYCRMTEKWITRLVETEDSGRLPTADARRMSYWENDGMLQCSLELGHVRFRQFIRAVIVCGVRRMVFGVAGVSLGRVDGERREVFVITLKDME